MQIPLTVPAQVAPPEPQKTYTVFMPVILSSTGTPSNNDKAGASVPLAVPVKLGS